MARPIRPGAVPAHRSALAGWLVVAGAALLLAATTLLWAAGQITVAAATGAWPPVPWSVNAALGALTDPALVWPGIDPARFVAVAALGAVLLLAPAVAVGAVVLRRGVASDSPLRALAGRAQMQPLTLRARRTQVRRLRPGLGSVRAAAIPAAEAGVALGRLMTTAGVGPQLYAGWEDVATLIMAPRSGKTTAYAIPAVLGAPGPVVATSNKADLLVTAPLRRRLTGQPVWVFDPQQLAHSPQQMWWNPLAGVDSLEAAERLAGHFLAGVKSERDKIWSAAATELLGGLLLAAALGGLDLSAVYGWLGNEHTDVPPRIADQHGFAEVAGSLRGFARLPHETRGSVYFTARAATACLRNPAIMAWVSPRPQVQEFLPAGFITTRQSLYLLSKDSGGSAAPLVAALADAIIRAGIAAAQARGGRLDPPLVVVLDEAASVAPIADLPTLVSHAGSRAIFVMTILQSYPQGEAVWQATGMKALWSASTIKVIGPGQDDASFNESVSKLLGEQWVTTGSWSAGEKSTHASTTVSRQRAMDAGQVRALPKGTALLIATGHRPAMLRLCPWYDGPFAAELAQADQDLTARIATAAAHARPGAAAGVQAGGGR